MEVGVRELPVPTEARVAVAVTVAVAMMAGRSCLILL